jgi:transposase
MRKHALNNSALEMDRRFTVRYTQEERLGIGRRIYNGEISKYAAGEEYGISVNSARDYMRLYRDTNQLPPKNQRKLSAEPIPFQRNPQNLEDFESKTKEELIRELVKARITEARLKKGYMVKGDGPDKEYILLDSKNTK